MAGKIVIRTRGGKNPTTSVTMTRKVKVKRRGSKHNSAHKKG